MLLGFVYIYPSYLLIITSLEVYTISIKKKKKCLENGRFCKKKKKKNHKFSFPRMPLISFY